jgi:nucleoside-diphosphate-sugar epimerase
MRVGVTGAAGFLGGYVVQALKAAGHAVELHLGPPGTPGVGACFAMHDAPAVAAWAEGLDGVVHLAGPPWIGASFDDPVGCMQAHVTGTAALCAARPPWLIFASSAAVYAPSRGPLTEDACCRPRSPYAIAKRAAEQLIQVMGIPAMILRLFNVYGPGGHPRSVLGRILAQRASDRVQLHDATPRRDFVHVSDVARGVVSAIAHVHPDAPIVNLGSGSAVSVRSLVERVGALSGRALNLRETAPGTTRPVEVCAAISKADQLLNWRPHIDLNMGLRGLVRAGGE